jgi:CHAD domain-containing protein
VKIKPNRVEKPFRKLRKQLNAFHGDPGPEDVHSLRTQTRRIEATFAALVLDRNEEPHRLIELITPVRKAAGKVRDMDVLIGDVLTLSRDHANESLVRLAEHLAKIRVKSARKLGKVIDRKRSKTRKRLKQSSTFFRKALANDSSTLNCAAAPQILITKLCHWPDLDANNLHRFRIQIKELRYMLQLSDQANKEFVDRLGEVKDSIGEWHDWTELLRIAKKVLDPNSHRGVLRRIEKIADRKFRKALTTANQVRRRYLGFVADARGSEKVLQMATGFSKPGIATFSPGS